MQTLVVRAQYKTQIRDTILNAAREIFVHESYEAFSIRKLAAKIGYSPAAIYKHFTSKAEIFGCLVEESFSLLLRASEAVKEIEGEDPVVRLKRGMWAYVEFGLKNPDHYRFAFLLQANSATRGQKPAASYEGLKKRIGVCIETGKFAEEDPELVAQTLWAAAHGVTSLLIQRPGFPWVQKRRLIGRVIDNAVDGFRAK